MKILKIRHCGECKNYRCTYDYDVGVSRILCQHSAWANRKNGSRIINKRLAMKGKIPWWCRLENYEDCNK